jgi:hypothetical protein
VHEDFPAIIKLRALRIRRLVNHYAITVAKKGGGGDYVEK